MRTDVQWNAYATVLCAKQIKTAIRTGMQSQGNKRLELHSNEWQTYGTRKKPLQVTPMLSPTA